MYGLIMVGAGRRLEGSGANKRARCADWGTERRDPDSKPGRSRVTLQLRRDLIEKPQPLSNLARSYQGRK
jgi:hypothetical protein